MAISQRQFAAEILDAEDNAAKFDDIGCMLRYLGTSAHKPSAVFVIDYANRRWVDANEAFFVRGSKVATPMNGGTLAFRQQSDAEATARQYGGSVLAFRQLARQLAQP